MSGVEVPAELLIDLVDGYEELAKAVSGEMSDGTLWPEALNLISRARALLPQPAPTGPNCGDKDTRHGGDGCEALLCDCWLSREALPQVRALLAAAPGPRYTDPCWTHLNAGAR